MSASYLWFKALRVVFMVTWFAGLSYLPRLLLAHAKPRTHPAASVSRRWKCGCSV